MPAIRLFVESGLAASNGEARLMPGYTVGLLAQEPPLNDAKTVLVDLVGTKDIFTRQDIEDKFALNCRHGGFDDKKTSAALKLAKALFLTRRAIARCGTSTPFGFPVVPELWIMTAGRSSTFAYCTLWG